MAAEKPVLKDALVARYILEAGSALGSFVAPVRRLVNTIDAPNFVPSRWYAMRERADTISDWVTFDGYKASGNVPRNYKEAAIIKVDRERLDALRKEVGGVHAVGYELGTAAMVGVMDARSMFEIDPEDERFYDVAMGVGKGALRATAGLWKPDERRLVVAEDSLSRGETLPINQLPSHIPLL